MLALGLQGGAEDWVDRLGLVCGRVNNPGQQTTPAVYGRSGGGSAFFETCGAAGFLSGVAGRAGKYVDRVQGYCRAQN